MSSVELHPPIADLLDLGWELVKRFGPQRHLKSLSCELGHQSDALTNMESGGPLGARAITVNALSAPMRRFQFARSPIKQSNFAMPKMFGDI